MQVCLMIEGQEGVTWDQWLELARVAEEHRFHTLFRSDHYVSFFHPAEWGSLDAWATIAALSSRTDRLRLGTMVSPVSYRHPSNLAKSVVTVDHASGGRVELGLGAGWFEREHSAYGFAFPPVGERFDAFEEYIEVVHRLWSGGSVTFEGAHFRLEDCPAVPTPVQDPHPPLIVGGEGGPRSVALAARWADEYNLVQGSVDDAVVLRERLATACDAVSRDPEAVRRSVMLNTLVGSDEADLLARAGRMITARAMRRDPASYLAEDGAGRLFGTPDQVVERLAAFAEAGVHRVLCQYLPHEDIGGIALIGREVVPAAAAL